MAQENGNVNPHKTVHRQSAKYQYLAAIVGLYQSNQVTKMIKIVRFQHEIRFSSFKFYSNSTYLKKIKSSNIVNFLFT